MIFKDIKTTYPSTFVTKINDKNVYIDGVIDGETIEVNGNNVKILKKSNKRINDGCKYQDLCGGCQFMHINYEYELKLKEKFINETLSHHFKDIKVIGADEFHLNYRNKCQMNYTFDKKGNILCGLYEEHSHNIVLVDECMLQPHEANELIKAINVILKKNKIMPYKKGGVLKNIFIRYGFNSKEMMVVFVTSDLQFPGGAKLVKDLVNANLGITTIVQNINPRDTPIVLGDKDKTLYGKGFINETLASYKFKISPNSFFQINTNMMETIYNEAINMANLNKDETVIDAYSGIGSISIFIAKHVKKVISVELNKNAHNDAIINAKLNNINNIKFINDDATRFINNLSCIKIDAIFIDPPRDGTTPQFISAVSKLKIKKVIYISCNPLTLNRDLFLFKKERYIINNVVAIDNFAKTKHLESIATLTLKK